MIYRFGTFELNEESGELLQHGQAVEIQPKPLALLQLLVRERHRVVELDELFESLWPDTAVTAGSLTRAVSVARRAIGDTHRGAIIRSFARRGYRFCAEVIEVGDESVQRRARFDALPAAPGGADASLPPGNTWGPLVGRDEALAALRAELDDGLAGRGGLALVAGSPGIGKTRLVEAFAAEVEGRGPSVVFGRAREGEGVPAFWPWTQVLRGLLADPVLGAPLRELAEPGGELAPLSTALERGTDRIERDSGAAAAQRRFRLFDAFAGALARCGRARPLVIVLEDMQWAGEASLRLLEHLVFELRNARVLLVVTIREEPRDRAHPVERLLSLLRRQSHARQIPLRGLSRREVALLLEHALGCPSPPDLTSELYAHTEGVPLFVGEAIRLLRERGALRHPERIAREGLVLPARSFDFIRRALDALEPASLAMLEGASVLGREFPLPLLAAVAGLERDEVLERLDEAEGAGVVAPSSETPATWCFAHALFREAVYEGLSTSRKARLHQAAALQLEQQHRDDVDIVLTELAHHLHQGLAVGDPQHAFEVAWRAAARAQRMLAYEQAAAHLEQASVALEQFPATDPTQRLEVWLALGEAYRCAGNRTRRREVFARALESARGLAKTAELVRAAIGLCDISEWSVRDPVAEEALQEALGRLGEDPGAERARLLTRLAYQSILEERARPEALARRAVAHARRTGDAEALQEALYTLHFAIAGPDALEERQALVQELLESARPGEVLDTTVMALIDVACDRIELGDAAGARRFRAEAERVAGLRPHPGMVWHIRLFDAGMALMEGRFEEARILTGEAYVLGRRIGHPYARACYEAHLVGIARERGDHEEVVRLFGRGVTLERGAVHYVRGVMARSLWALERSEAAREHFEHLACADFEDIPRNIRWTDTLVEIAHLCAELGDDARAKTLAALLTSVEGHHGVLAVPVCYGGPVAFARARLLAQLGRRDEAVELLEEARSSVRALAARPAQARIELALGRLLARSGESRRARESFHEAFRLASELGMPEVEGAARKAAGC